MLQMTESAKDYLNSVRPDDGHVTLTVNGGGCAGFTYKWGTSDEYIEKDALRKWLEVEDILLVDPIAEMYILGSIVDYVREIEGSFLTIKNPMATSSCGCGESFGV
jgi:iron-sulfur cluster insertion protein|tara:strand:- start:1197 stop:1514 length:318 start_codon:yes stop_codon:yes gene_type:complete